MKSCCHPGVVREPAEAHEFASFLPPASTADSSSVSLTWPLLNTLASTNLQSTHKTQLARVSSTPDLRCLAENHLTDTIACLAVGVRV